MKATVILALSVLVGAAGYWQWLLPRGLQPPQTFILILVDTLNDDALGCYGNPLPTSPNIDALAAEGSLFKQAISSSGWTLPSVASIFTGAWPKVHGAYGKDKKFAPIRPDLPVAAELFSQAGFNTFAVSNASFLNARFGFDRGFDVFDFDPALMARERRGDKCVNRALELLRENKGESNFLFLHLFDPHLPYDPPKDFRGVFAPTTPDKVFPLYKEKCLIWPGQKSKYEYATKRGQKDDRPPAEHVEYLKQVYHEEVNFTDTQVGRLVGALREMGIYESTTIVLVADHGEEFWEHDGFEHGHTLFEELIKVPMIIKPEKRHPVTAHEITTQVRSLDIMPTLFQYAGIETPDTFIGAPLQALMSGETQPHRLVYPERTLYGDDHFAVRNGTHKLILDVNPTDGESAFELYNIQEDPLEQKDIAATQPEKLEELKALLFGHFGDVADISMQKPIEKPLDLDQDEIERLKSLGYIR